MASAFKAKGNEAFKAGDYAAAIGEYTKAIMAEPKDTTFPLNRAAAYLKLDKFKDAERDCGNVLALDPKNIKALFRRGQARSGLGNYTAAKADIDQVLVLEPSNQVAKQELAKIKALLELEQKKASQKRAPREISVPVAPYRRRVPIDIVEDADTPPQPAEVKSQGSSKRPLIEELPDPTPESVRPSPPVIKSFQQAKEERSTRTTKTIGGGIFKRDGSNSDDVFRAKKTTITASSSPPAIHSNGNTTTASAPMAKPANSFEFQRRWQAESTSDAKWAILHSISPETLPTFFKNSLEAPLLMSIFSAMHDIVLKDRSKKALLAQYLQQFSKVPRLETLLLFLGARDKQLIRELIDAVEQPVGWEI